MNGRRALCAILVVAAVISIADFSTVQSKVQDTILIIDDSNTGLAPANINVLNSFIDAPNYVHADVEVVGQPGYRYDRTFTDVQESEVMADATVGVRKVIDQPPSTHRCARDGFWCS
jgi:hypothetical protein